MKTKENTDTKKTKGFSPLTIVLMVLCVGLIMIMYGQKRTRSQYKEAAELPYYQFNISDVADGTYTASTVTSFIHVELQVSVEDHKISDIKILQNYGAKGKHVEPIIQTMIEKNSDVVEAIKGEELASMAFISCANAALKKGLNE